MPIRALSALCLVMAMTFIHAGCRTELPTGEPPIGELLDAEAFSGLNAELDFFDAGYGATVLLDGDRGLVGSIAFRANNEGSNQLMLLEFDATGSSLQLDTRVLADNIGDVLAMQRFPDSDRRAIAVALLQPGGTPNVGLVVEQGSGWQNVPLDTSDANGLFLDMAIDNNGVVHLAYVSQDAQSLRYLQWQDGLLITQPSEIVIVDRGTEPGETSAGGSIDRAVSLVLDADNVPVVAYYDSRNGQLRIARQRTSDLTWDIHVVGSTTLGRLLTVSDSGVAKVSQSFIPRKAQLTLYKNLVPLEDSTFTVDSSTQLRITDYDANAEYTLDFVQPVSLDYGSWSTLRLSDSGYAALSFFDQRGGRMMYAVNNDIGNTQRWSIETVDRQGIVGSAHDLILLPFFDDAGVRRGDIPVIAYQDIGNSDLKLAFFGQNEWQITRLHAAGLTGFGPSMAATNDHNVVVVYREHRADERFSANLQVTRTLPIGF